jgi:actin related protein 2/3 complex, subunit 1A/1B
MCLFNNSFYLYNYIEVAICPNNNAIEIYDTSSWNKLFTLQEHDLIISSIDWSAANNKIVSCSHDRNAFVWTFEEATADEPAKWRHALCLIRIDRAAMSVKWDSDGLRFAVGSASKCVPVCTYDESGDWWVSKMIKKKIKSTVTCVSFHPTNGQVLATGSTDFKCRVFSTYSADVDGSDASDVVSKPFRKPVEFGEMYCELSATSWINAVAWSPSGNVLAYTSHDSCISFATFTTGDPVVQSIRFGDLPLMSLMFVAEQALVGAGHEFNPTMYTCEDGKWAFKKKIDEKKTATASAATGVTAARALFQNKTARGQEKVSDSDTLWTKHENTITAMSDASPAGTVGPMRKLCTSSLDGRLVTWDLTTIDVQLASLHL